MTLATTITASQATLSTASANLSEKLKQSVQQLTDEFASALAQQVQALLSQGAGNTSTASASSTATAAPTATATTATVTSLPTVSATPASTVTATASSATSTWQAPWMKNADQAGQYLLGADSTEQQRNTGKPNMAEFMQRTGADASTAASTLYGVVGSNTDYRNWDAIMAADDPLTAARQATGALYQSDLTLNVGDSFKPTAQQTLAQAGSYAWLNVDNREGLWLMDQQGAMLRQLPLNAPDILRASRDFGFDPAVLSNLADQLDALAVNYQPGGLYSGSDAGVDLRAIAKGQLGSAYDWTQDPLVGLKGPTAVQQLRADIDLAQELGINTAQSSIPGTSQQLVSDLVTQLLSQRSV